MRLWKKVSAMVAMAAMCMTLAVPVTASATEVDARLGGCPGGCNWTDTMVGYRVDSTYTHEYVSIIPHPNGMTSIVPGECTVEVRTEIYYKACRDCGIVQIEGSNSDIPDKHYHCGL